jgi:vesicle-fusing ATPase
VNGPEVLNKYVGQSEENIRNLFAEADEEYRVKVRSPVIRHIIEYARFLPEISGLR